MEIYADASVLITIYGQESLGPIVGKDYERKVMGTLDTINCNQVGRFLLQSLNNTLDIYPYSAQDVSILGQPNAYTLAKDVDAAGQKGAPVYAAGRPILQNGVVRRYATGGGTGSDIHFSPDDWMTSGMASNQCASVAPNQRRDEVLFHEISHALMNMVGVQNGSIPPTGFSTKNDFWAVMSTNIYTSAWNRPLRKSHQSGTQISQTDADALYLKYASMVDWMCRDIPSFTRSVAQLEWIPFNPFRDSYKRQKAKLGSV